MYTRHVKESLANAKEGKRVYEGCPLAKKSMANQHKEHNVDKYIQWVLTLLLTIWVYLHLFSTVVASKICEIPRSSPKIRINGQTPLQHNWLTENTLYEQYTSTALIWINQGWYKL